MDDKNINLEEQEVLIKTEEVNVEESSEEVVAKKPNKLIAITLVAGVAAVVAFVALDPFSVFNGDAIEIAQLEGEILEEELLGEETEIIYEEVIEIDEDGNEVVTTVETEVATTKKEVAKETTTATTSNSTVSNSTTSNSTASNSTSSNTHACTWKTTTEQVLVKAAYDVTESKTVDVYRKCNVSSDGRNYTLEWEAYCASNGSVSFSQWNGAFGGSYTTKSVVVGQETYYNTTTVPAEYKTVSTTTCTVCGAVK